jgi:fatty acid desaturase
MTIGLKCFQADSCIIDSFCEFIITENMEDNAKLIKSLLEKVTEYGKTSLELAKLRALDKTSDVVSSLLPQLFIILLIATFMLLLSVGLAVWLGEILGKIYFGFFLVAAFYGLAGIIIHFFMHKWLKKMVRNNFIKQVLK